MHKIVLFEKAAAGFGLEQEFPGIFFSFLCVCWTPPAATQVTAASQF